MERWQVKVVGLLLLMTTVGVGGCSRMWSLDGPATSVSHAEFTSLWKTYAHCRSGSDPDEMRADAEHLDRAVRAITRKAQAPPLLPHVIQTLISEPPSRLAVDPKAMAMACALYAGQTAQSLGRLEVAADMFNSIVTAQAQPAYDQYVIQASRGLEQLEQDIQFVMDTRDQTLQVISR